MSEGEPPWGDGLPMVDAGDRAIETALAAAGLPRDEPLGQIPPGFERVTAGQLAEVAVMAGCLAEYFPVVEAALRACLAPSFNLLGIQTTTEMPTPLLVVNGPVRKALAMNAGVNLFGPGSRANATIGRAVRLALTRFGKAVPGAGDMATFGHPGKYTYCIAEHEERSPWEPFHVERGFAGDESVVTAVGADAPVNVNYGHGDAEELLQMIGQTMAIPGSNNVLLGGEVVVVLSPQHASVLAKAGWSKEDVRTYLFEHGKVAAARIPARIRDRVRRRRGLTAAEDSPIPSADSPEAILLLVAGGMGGHSAVVPTFGATRAGSARLLGRGEAGRI